MNKTLTLSFGKIQIENRIVTAEINEGVHLTLELSEEIVLSVFKSIGDKPTIYISNRINSYSIDPTLYSTISNIKNIIGIAIVNDMEIFESSVQIEKFFFKNKFKHFNTLSSAISWAEKELALYNI
ncbi:hypothetical protein [Lacinutrix mariniflava]|uniref:hypothetical protein n=1 Tax=Lacinutrix mariniflava TaxID=342955 RepID=UPI0006E36C1D|nr:hypothetical protein [Lacinutrix mariniflava]